MSPSRNGGDMGLYVLSSTFLSGLALEGSGGRPLAYGRVAG